MKKPKFYPREKDLADKWWNKNKLVTVNNQQYSFDTEERRRRFIENQFETKTDFEEYKI